MKTIRTCAVTGNLTRAEQNPNLPITPDEIAQSSLAAAAAGAAIVHIHVRHTDGRPLIELAHYREAVRLIRAKSDALEAYWLLASSAARSASDEARAMLRGVRNRT